MVVSDANYGLKLKPRVITPSHSSAANFSIRCQKSLTILSPMGCMEHERQKNRSTIACLTEMPVPMPTELHKRRPVSWRIGLGFSTAPWETSKTGPLHLRSLYTSAIGRQASPQINRPR